MSNVQVYGRFEWRCPQHGLMRYVVDAGKLSPVVGDEPCGHMTEPGVMCRERMQPVYVSADQGVPGKGDA